MKRFLTIIAACILFYSSSQAQFVKLYLGVSGGAGDMLTHDQFHNLPQTGSTFIRNNNGWSSHFKAQALLGLGRFRVGYQFLYNFASPSIGGYSITPPNDGAQYTTYFNASQVHFFGQYLLLELAIVNTKHFALVPGFAVGSYTGYKIDNTSGEHVALSETTNQRFSIGGELNFEIKFARRWTIFASPNYYLFSMRDRENTDWHEAMHFFGGDIGVRLNLLKVKKD